MSDPADVPEPTESSEEAQEDPQQVIEDLRDRLARARADYDNLQKRHLRDAAIERDRVKARVLEHFLQVHEYARLALVEAGKTPGPLADGVTMLVREFDRLLESEGVTPVGQRGEAFDASMHEALAEAPADDVEAGHITEVIAPGYRLGDRILRYAKVVVAAPDAAGDE